MDIKPGFYQHFKGNLYEVIGTATHSETPEAMVVYRALYDECGLWMCPAAMWNEAADRDGYHGPRFHTDIQYKKFHSPDLDFLIGRSL